MKVLSGIKILSLCANLPGPVATFKLTEMGAEVTKVEPVTGDPLNHALPAFYKKLTEKQKVLTLNLKESEDLKNLFSLLEDVDVFLTSNRIDALSRLGLSWNELHARFPKLCFVAIVGHSEGNTPGHDLTYQAEAGLLSPPQMPLAPLADMAGAEIVVSNVLGLLFNRERTKQSGHAIVSLAEAAKSFSLPKQFGLTGKNKILGGAAPAYKLYRSKNGWIALAALEVHFENKLKTELKLEKLTIESLEKIFLEKKSEEWEAWARALDIPLSKVVES